MIGPSFLISHGVFSFFSAFQIKSLHEAELLASDERAAAKYVSAVEELRDQLTQEKDKSLVRERELAQQKFDRQLDEEMKVGL